MHKLTTLDSLQINVSVLPIIHIIGNVVEEVDTSVDDGL